MIDFNSIRENWSNSEILSLTLLGLVERQLELAELMARDEASFNAAFISEKENAYKGTDSMARARAKSYVGTNATAYEYEFGAITNLIGVINVRISLLVE